MKGAYIYKFAPISVGEGQYRHEEECAGQSAGGTQPTQIPYGVYCVSVCTETPQKTEDRNTPYCYITPRKLIKIQSMIKGINPVS